MIKAKRDGVTINKKSATLKLDFNPNMSEKANCNMVLALSILLDVPGFDNFKIHNEDFDRMKANFDECLLEVAEMLRK